MNIEYVWTDKVFRENVKKVLDKENIENCKLELTKELLKKDIICPAPNFSIFKDGNYFVLFDGTYLKGGFSSFTEACVNSWILHTENK